MNTATRTGTILCNSVWYQEPYFLGALQDEIDTARSDGTALCLILLRMTDYTRNAARHLYAYAEAEDGHSFFGILGNGDYAICMPGSGYTEGTQERVALANGLGQFDVCSGLAVLDAERSARELLQVASEDCQCDGSSYVAGLRAA